MGNSNIPPNKAGYVEDFTPEEYALYELHCRPDHDREKNNKLCFMGFDFYSDTGFISDEDSLKDVALRDSKYVIEKLGAHGHEIIAIKLMMVTTNKSFEVLQELNGDGFAEHLKDHYLGPSGDDFFSVKHVSYNGNQGCPFFEKRTFRTTRDDPSLLANDANAKKVKEEFAQCGFSGNASGCDYEITNLKTKKVLKGATLQTHLVYHHHFYEGDVRYRLNPKDVIEVLEIPYIGAEA